MEQISIYGEYRANLLAREWKRIGEAGLSERNVQLFRQFEEYQFSKGCGQARIAKVLSQLRYIIVVLQKDLDTLDKGDIVKFFAALNKTEIEYYTKRDYWRAIGQFYRFHDEDSPLLKVIRSHRPNGKQREHGAIISDEQIIAVLKAEPSLRNRALISLLHETGIRAAELLNLRIQDVTKQQNINHIRVYGKTGERLVPFVASAPGSCGG